MFGGSVDIDVIHTDAGTADDLQLRRLLQELAIDDGSASHDDSIHFRNELQQFFARYFVVNNRGNRAGLLNYVDPGGIDAVK